MKTLQQFLDILCLWHTDLEQIDDPASAFCYRCGNDVYEIRRCVGCRDIFALEESQDFIPIADRNLCCHCAEADAAVEYAEVCALYPTAPSISFSDSKHAKSTTE